MRPKVLLHTAVFLDVVAALKVFAQRALAEHLRDGIISPQNLPLALLVLITVSLAEISSNRLNGRRSFAFGLLGVLFFTCSFYISMESQFKDEASVLAYAAILFQFSTVIVSTFQRRDGFKKIFTSTLLIFLALTFVGFLYTFYEGETFHNHSSVNAVVVLGASVWGKQKPSPLLRGRLDAAIAVYKAGNTNRIVVTGGTKRFGTVESEVEASYLRESGMPDSDIMSEHSTLSTSDQVRFVKDVLMDSLGMKKIVVVSDNWHLPRVLLMFHCQDAKVEVMASNYKMQVPSELYYRVRESAALQVYLLFGA